MVTRFWWQLGRTVPLVKFSYNNSYQASIGIVPFEALYDKPCSSLTCWVEGQEQMLVGPELIHETKEVVWLIHQRIKVA